MSWAISDVIDEARSQLTDEREPYRYTDEKLYRAMNMAFAETRRLRPDLFHDQGYTPPTYETTDGAEEFPLADMMFPTIVDYIVARQAFADDEFTMDGRAANFYQKWQGNLIGGLGG